MSKPVIKKENLVAYVSTDEMITFIDTNNDNLEWNDICDLVQEQMFNEEGQTLVIKSDYTFPKKKPKHLTTFTFSWFREFFEAHPFLPERVMFVFDD